MKASDKAAWTAARDRLREAFPHPRWRASLCTGGSQFYAIACADGVTVDYAGGINDAPGDVVDRCIERWTAAGGRVGVA